MTITFVSQQIDVPWIPKYKLLTTTNARYVFSGVPGSFDLRSFGDE